MKKLFTNKVCFLKLLILLFVFITSYFFIFTTKYNYLGITSDIVENNWVVKSIHNGGAASSTQLSIGDTILKINNEKAEDNFSLNNWLIVEQASSVTVLHNAKKLTISFKDNSDSKYLFLIFCVLSLSLFLFSFIYFKRKEISQTNKRYYIFLVLTSLFLISIVPSSMGNFLARLIMILYITLFPLFIDIFWRASILKQQSTKISFFSKIVMLYSTVTLILLAYCHLFSTPIIIVKYLSRSIFYISFILLIILFLISLSKSSKHIIIPRINLIFLVILCLIPLFIGYVFPLPYNIPFSYTIPLLIIPILAIINNLIINRLTNFRFNVPISVLYVLLSVITIIIMLSLYLITNYLPWWLMFSYTFFLILCLIPILKDAILLNTKTEYKLINQTIFSAVELERENISIYIHDTIVQDIIYYKKQIENKDTISKTDILNSLDDIIFELRDLCSNIYPLMIQELGLQNAIMDIVNKFQKKELVVIQAKIKTNYLDFGNIINNFVLRSIREMINNSILHGNVKTIDINIYDNEQETIFEIMDDGHFGVVNDTTSSHFGLNVISEKLFLLGGELVVEKNPTKISMKIPKRKGEL